MYYHIFISSFERNKTKDKEWESIMSETYVECLVKKESSFLGRVAYIALIVLTVALVLVGLIGFWPALIGAIATGAGAYFAYLNASVEYEYMYLDKELSVDKILAQTKRKKVAAFEIERMEILAPIKSYHLDNYKNRTAKEVDFSIGKEEQPDKRYVMFYDGNQKILLNPNEQLIKAIRNVAPRKVFTD